MNTIGPCSLYCSQQTGPADAIDASATGDFDGRSLVRTNCCGRTVHLGCIAEILECRPGHEHEIAERNCCQCPPFLKPAVPLERLAGARKIETSPYCEPLALCACRQACRGDMDTFKTLLAQEPGIARQDFREAVTGQGVRLLQVAVKAGQAELTQLLLKYSADINTADHRGNTALHLATAGGHDQCLRELLKHGPELDCRDNTGSTPLHLAIENNNGEFLKLLLDYGADPTVADDEGLTPLHLAAKKSYINNLRQLLQDNRVAINAADKSGKTPLHHSALSPSEGSIECLQLLITHQANVNAVNESLCTPLHHAVVYSAVMGNREKMQYLIDHGADLESKDISGQTPLHRAADWGRLEVVQLLITHHADIHSTDKNGMTPLHLAIKNGNIHCQQLLTDASQQRWDWGCSVQ
ncbi:ankyrin repeat domain-containing protein [Salinisphaera sp. G21_0]|uniref:ankyrin repeat domain-containing protein n=1 Tax=Salinisphaera sp. G21_0 TaxID=2821094 RepID=UPI001AD9CB20|nr:ankyrin repeat domain-containing protein [Salinisphaera sp. G21_0]MBO9481521.1 ankyrin repeat domain-containing protein [Salinisphaera sp. G21_0]